MSTADRLIRVDMTDLTATVEPYPEAWQLLGGRTLSAVRSSTRTKSEQIMTALRGPAGNRGRLESGLAWCYPRTSARQRSARSSGGHDRRHG